MLDELKPIMQNGERYIVVEGGRPEFVVLRFPDYVALVSLKQADASHGGSAARRSDWEHANVELEDARQSERDYRVEVATTPMPPVSDPAAIRLEDLPL